MNTETQTSNELQIVIDQNGLEQETRIALKNAFDPFYIQASEWKSKALALTVTDASQIKEMVDAREARLVLKGIRIDVEKTRKTLKEDSLRKGKAIDTIANTKAMLPRAMIRPQAMIFLKLNSESIVADMM